MSSTAAASSEYDFSAGPPLLERPSHVRRARRAFTRYLIAICIGIAATLAWQSYGDAIKQMIAAKAPELGWSPEVQQLIATTVQQLGWTKPAELDRGAPATAAPETAQQASVVQAAPDQAAPDPAAPAPAAPAPAAANPPPSPSPTLEQVQQMASDLAALKQAVGQLSSRQDQMAQDIAKVQATDQEVLNKVSTNKVATTSTNRVDAASTNKVTATSANKAAATKVSAPPQRTAAMPTHKHPPSAPIPSPAPSATLSPAPSPAPSEPLPPQPIPLR